MDLVQLSELIESSDLDGLVRFIDGTCRERAWDGLVDIRDRCRHALERGKQLWAAAEFAEYRLALEATGAHAAHAAIHGSGRNTLGPLWEVAASTHDWSDLEPHLSAGLVRSLIAHERLVRGDDLADATIDPLVLDLPLRLEPWEPRYPVAVYRPDKADFPEPDLPRSRPVALGPAGERLGDEAANEAWYELVRPWVEESNGRFEAVAVEGDGPSAIRALGPRSVGLAELTAQQALAVMAWTGSGGGAYGRRRGTPIGRLNAWWVLATLGDVEDGAGDPEQMGDAIAALRWYQWDPGDRVSGWGLHLAAEDPAAGIAWAVSAVDDW
jgi:hypothetical protein